MFDKWLTIDYTNYRGERGWRTIHPVRVFFGSNEHHPKPCFLLEAFDRDKQAMRTFAMVDIHSMRDEAPRHSLPLEFWQ